MGVRVCRMCESICYAARFLNARRSSALVDGQQLIRLSSSRGRFRAISGNRCDSDHFLSEIDYEFTLRIEWNAPPPSDEEYRHAGMPHFCDPLSTPLSKRDDYDLNGRMPERIWQFGFTRKSVHLAISSTGEMSMRSADGKSTPQLQPIQMPMHNVSGDHAWLYMTVRTFDLFSATAESDPFIELRFSAVHPAWQVPPSPAKPATTKPGAATPVSISNRLDQSRIINLLRNVERDDWEAGDRALISQSV